MSDDTCCSCEGIKKIVKDVVKEEFNKAVTELKTTRPGRTKERKRSKWQLFLKECIPKKMELPFKDRVKACSVEWKKKKAT